MSYNSWYADTYEIILEIADWGEFQNDIEKKVIAIFSWMPSVIMGVKHSKTERKYDIYSIDDFRIVINQCINRFNTLSSKKLLETNLDGIKEDIVAIAKFMYPLMGMVAVSKYLHFSAPLLFPMWDRQIRLSRNIKDSPEGYYQYMKEIQRELRIEENCKRAISKYSANPLRGWDIILMENR